MAGIIGGDGEGGKGGHRRPGRGSQSSQPSIRQVPPPLQILALLHEGPRRLRADYEAGRFVRFRRYMTSAGIALAEIEDAISFNNIHEGIHLGYILAQRKLVAA